MYSKLKFFVILGYFLTYLVRNLIYILLFCYYFLIYNHLILLEILNLCCSILSFYYNHSATDAFGKNPPLTIPDRQMQSFIIATNTHDQNVIRLDGRSYTFKSDDEVDVMAGKFKGVRGKVVRAGRQQRILIELAGFMTFATAYVPTDFIRKI